MVEALIGFLSFPFLPYIVLCFHDCWYYYRQLIRIRTVLLQWEQCFNVREGQKLNLLEAGVFPGARDSFNAKDPRVKPLTSNSPDGTRAIRVHSLLETLQAVYVRAFPVLFPGPSQPCGVKTQRKARAVLLLAHPLHHCWGLHGLWPQSGQQLLLHPYFLRTGVIRD